MSTTGPVIFSDETARTQLVEYGEVVTFRAGDPRTTGETGWRRERTGKEQAKVTVTEIGEIDPSNGDELAPHRADSGFESASDWQAAIEELNGGLASGYLYRTTLSGDESR